MVRKITRMTREFIRARCEINESTGCWLWTAALMPNGYGRLAIRADGKIKSYLAHRLSYELFFGPIPVGLYVCHHCDRRGCVNPEHLFLGTQKDNIRDALAKGRLATGDRNGSRLHPERRATGDRNGARLHPERVARGEKNHSAKLTAASVVEARKTHESGSSYANIAKALGVDLNTVWDAVNRRTWAHVT